MVRHCARVASALVVALLCLPRIATAETVFVKYRGEVALDTFNCQDVTDDSQVNRVCYDAAESYMLILLNSTYYHYCEIEPGVVQRLLNETSKYKFFTARIKGNGSDGPYDCRTHRVPTY